MRCWWAATRCGGCRGGNSGRIVDPDVVGGRLAHALVNVAVALRKDDVGGDRLRFLDFEGYQPAIFFLVWGKDDIFFKVHVILKWNDPF